MYVCIWCVCVYLCEWINNGRGWSVSITRRLVGLGWRGSWLTRPNVLPSAQLNSNVLLSFPDWTLQFLLFFFSLADTVYLSYGIAP